MSDENETITGSAGYGGAGPEDFVPAEPERPAEEPVTVVVEPAAHGEAAQRAANKMPHSERTYNGGQRL